MEFATQQDFVDALISAQKNGELADLLERRHPEYLARTSHWEFAEETYVGGPDWFKKNLHQYMKEGDKSFKQRLERAYRFNHTKEVVDLVNKYIYKSEINRRKEDIPAYLKRFWLRSSFRGMDVSNLMAEVCRYTSIFGRCYIIIDSNRTSDIVTVADEKSGKARVYAYVVKPMDVLDMGFDKLGELEWVLVKESFRQDDDFFTAKPISIRYRLWNKKYWALFGEKLAENGKDKVFTIQDVGEHGLGVVPMVISDEVKSGALYSSRGLIDDIVYMDKAVANYLSNMDAIVQDQTFSQLVIPMQSIVGTENPGEKLIEFGTKTIFTYDAAGGATPEYISPDPKQASLILEIVNKLISEIYHTVGMSGERTKNDNAVGIDNSSGVAKAFDFQRMNAVLCDKAQSMQSVENRIAKIVALWNNDAAFADTINNRKIVTYPDNFDLRDLYDEFAIAKALHDIGGPTLMAKQQMSDIVDKLFPQLKLSLIKKIKKDIEENWETPANSTNIKQIDRSKAPKQRRQGSVTQDTTQKNVANTVDTKSKV